jgi:anaerobic ribonucleoside-triphosphate reductase
MLDTINNKMLSIPSAEEREQIHRMLRYLPENDSLFKCHKCKTIFDIYSGGMPVLMALSNKNGILCPECKSESTELTCKVDAYSIYLKLSGFNCRKGELISGTDICPSCNRPICPECCNHQVVSLSRVTGYMSDISGWNNAKRQELKDRKRYTIDKN